jgi:hypothetical protein
MRMNEYSALAACACAVAIIVVALFWAQTKETEGKQALLKACIEAGNTPQACREAVP